MCGDELVTADLRIFPSLAFLVAAFTESKHWSINKQNAAVPKALLPRSGLEGAEKFIMYKLIIDKYLIELL